MDYVRPSHVATLYTNILPNIRQFATFFPNSNMSSPPLGAQVSFFGIAVCSSFLTTPLFFRRCAFQHTTFSPFFGHEVNQVRPVNKNSSQRTGELLPASRCALSLPPHFASLDSQIDVPPFLLYPATTSASFGIKQKGRRCDVASISRRSRTRTSPTC